MRGAALWIAALWVALWVAAFACNGKGNEATSPETPSSREAKTGKEEAANVEDRIRADVAEQLKVSPKEIEVDLEGKVEVPGLTVFTAHLPPPEKGRPGTFRYGVVKGERVITKRSEAMAAVVEAWGYGEERTVAPEKLAQVFGILEGSSHEPANAIYKQRQVDDLGKWQRELVFLPRETTVDGKPAIEYWVASGEPPLWKSTAVFETDGSVKIKVEEHWP